MTPPYEYLLDKFTCQTPGCCSGNPKILIAADKGNIACEAHQSAAFGSGGETVTVHAVHQAVHDLAHVAVVDLHGDGVLDSAELVEAAVLLLLGGGVLHGCGGGAGPGGEDEGEQGVVVDSLDQQPLSLI